MTKMKCSNVVGKEIPSMQKCLNLIPQLSSMELVDLVEAIEKEQKARKLEVERENVMIDIYVTGIQEALEQLYDNC